MRQQGDLLSADERKQKVINELVDDLGNVVKKLNYHLHSGFEANDLRKPESMFMNFFKKQPSSIHSSYLMRIKNRDFKLTMSEDRYVVSLHFVDHGYCGFKGMEDTIALLNAAVEKLDFEALKRNTNLTDKFFHTTNKIIQGIKDFKFPG